MQSEKILLPVSSVEMKEFRMCEISQCLLLYVAMAFSFRIIAILIKNS